MVDGLLVIDKPRGMTSFDVVAQVRRLYHMKKVGHAGTLDPNVSGVLVVALGKATKLIDELQTRPKTYIGEVTLGFATESEDLDGAEIAREPLERAFSNAEIDAAMTALTGDIIQIPPMFSAVKVNGKRLYEYARAGEGVERPQRAATIYRYERTDKPVFDAVSGEQKWRFEARVSKGTYIRTLAVDTGKSLGVPAVMSDLRRVEGSGLPVDKAVSLADLATMDDDQRVAQLQTLDAVLADWPRIDLNEAQWFAVRNGQKVLTFGDVSGNKVRLYFDNELKSVYEYDADAKLWRSRYVFANE
ncbi:MAG TPA: tRNA pseudouridine(55) synthase TruB [Lactobacillaceae bacterium]|jgi:tRNA pseudouridine55 synthase